MKTKPDNMERLTGIFCRMFKCDTARISSPLGKTMFLIIGHNRNTRQDEGKWLDGKGRRRDWDYVQETCIASGDTETALMRSARHYKKLLGMSMARMLLRETGGGR